MNGVFKMTTNKPTPTRSLAFLLVVLMVSTTFGVVFAGEGGEENAKDDFEVALSLKEDEKTISSGDSTFYEGKIHNTGKLNDSYKITFGGKDYDKEGVAVRLLAHDTDEEVDPDNIDILAGGNFPFDLMITIEGAEDEYEITLMVSSHSDNEVWDAQKTRTFVVEENKKEYDFEFWTREEEQTTTYGVPVSYFISLKNTGNIDNVYTMELLVPEEYNNLETTLMLMDDETYGVIEIEGTEFELEAEVGQERVFILEIKVNQILYMDDDENDEKGNFADPGDLPTKRYSVKLSAVSQNGPERLGLVRTITTIKHQDEGHLVFNAYETGKSIRAGGETEYVLVLANQGWSPIEAKMALLEHQYGDVEAELFLIAPYWYYDAVDGQEPGMRGVIYDEEGNVVYIDETQILWEDYGGLIPVQEGFSYVVSPYESVELLLTVKHLHEDGDGNITPTIHSAEYELGVQVTTDEPVFEKTVVIKTEVIFNPIYGIDLELEEERKATRPQEPVEYFFTLKNTGNVETLVEMEIAGDALGLEGVYADLYALNHWTEPLLLQTITSKFETGPAPWIFDPDDPRNYIDSMDPIVVYEDGEKTFYNEDCIRNPFGNPDLSIFAPQGIQLYLEAGREVRIVLGVSIDYEVGEFNLSVSASVAEQPNTWVTLDTQTVVKPGEYQGFVMEAFETEQSTLLEQPAEYHINIYNPGYYEEVIKLELGGEDIADESVTAQLFMQRNIYYYDYDYDEFLRKDNGEYMLEYAGGVYDPSLVSEQEFRDTNPDFDEDDLPWDPATAEVYYTEEGNHEEYYYANTGAIYKNYEYEKNIWQDPAKGFDEDEWLIPIKGEDMTLTVGPFEEVWLLLRVSSTQEGEVDIDLSAQSVKHPEYRKTIATLTTVMGEANYGLELFIGDPVHYTAYGVTTVYVFQLKNTGNVMDHVLLDVAGKDAYTEGVYIELGVSDTVTREPVFFMDGMGNAILPYNDKEEFEDDKYHYEQWLENGETDAAPGMGGVHGAPDDDFQKKLATGDGELVEGDVNEIFLGTEPVEYGYFSWEFGEGEGEEILFQNAGEEGPGQNQGFLDLDRGFIPIGHLNELYVDIDAGETLIVTMKVTIFNWDDDVLEDDEYKTSGDDPEKGTSSGGGGTGSEKEADPDDTEEKKNEDKDRTEKPYELTLRARSRKAVDVAAKAKTQTHIYSGPISEDRDKFSGIFNVNDRHASREILENGFEIIPQALESGRIEVKVKGEFDEGRHMLLNLNKTNLLELGNFDVLFDRLKISEMPLDEIMDYSGDEAKYSIEEGVDGTLVVVYIPYFSEHTITIESSEQADTQGDGGNAFLLVGGLFFTIMVGLIGLGYVQRKEEEKKKDFKLKLHEEESKTAPSPEKAQPAAPGSTLPSLKNNNDLEKLLNEDLFFGKK